MSKCKNNLKDLPKSEFEIETDLFEKAFKLVTNLKDILLIVISVSAIAISLFSYVYIKDLESKNEVLEEKIERLDDQIKDWINRKDYLLARANMFDDLMIFSNIEDIVEYSPRIWR